MHNGRFNTHIPFGVRNGRTYAAREVETGLACQCRCPGCGRPLLAKNAGRIRRPHFTHYRVNLECWNAGETAIHWHAKQLIAEKARLMLPAWNGTPIMPNPPRSRDDSGNTHYGHNVGIPGRVVALTSAQIEKRQGDLQPDVSAVDAEGILLIEIRVAHAVGEAKIRKVQSDGARMLEIDLSKVRLMDALDPERFEHLVLGEASNRQWLSHPAAAQAWRDSRDELKHRVQDINRQIAAQRLVEHPRPRRSIRHGTQQIEAVDLANHEPLDQECLDAMAGLRIWHRGLGDGVIRERLVENWPVYDVRFDDGRTRKILLRAGFPDWKFV